RGLDCRRPHFWKNAWCRRPESGRPRTRSCRYGTTGTWLEKRIRLRYGARYDGKRSRSNLVYHSHKVEQQLLLEPIRLRMGTDKKSRRRTAMGSKGGQRHYTRCTRPFQTTSSNHAYHRSRIAVRPRI